ncbi:MAG TPA: molybdopterin cofactor-binding domain-containing protein [Azospirillaceae bacterium]|nr:molybdopterin cofactor-binding domain-containing protein [Azospirillaceae bacterium]
MTALSRRGFIAAAATAGAGLVIGFDLPAGAAPASPGAATVNGWVRIGPDGVVTLLTNASELGQGSRTVVPQILAEELEVDWAAIRIDMAPIQDRFGTFGTPPTFYGTGGSSAVRRQFDKLRKVGAAARLMLVQAAAERWQVPAAECRAEAGHVLHPPSNRRIAYGAVAEAAAALPVPADPPLKPRSEWRIIGRTVPREDIPAKVDGSAVYGIDVVLPDMLVATIMQAPVFGAKLGPLDEAPALAVPGVRKVVPIRGVRIAVPTPGRGPTYVALADAVAVVADRYWQAAKGLEALKPVWEGGLEPDLDTAKVFDRLRAAKAGNRMVPKAFWRSRDDGGETAEPPPYDLQAASTEAGIAFANAARVLEAEYTVPYLYHAQMEPMTAVARAGADKAEIWVGTQNQTGTRRVLAALLSLPEDRVSVETTYVGGGFGRRYQHDVAPQAALLSRAMDGRPVKLIWSREEDMRQGRYRPAALASFRAALDGAGRPAAVAATVTNILGIPELGRGGVGGAEAMGSVSETGIRYRLPALVATVPTPEAAVPTGPWRSVHTTQNVFFFESFMDELAHAAKADPVAFRRSYLEGDARAQRVLDLAAEKSGWGRPLPKGHGRGVAFWYSFQSLAAAVAEVSVLDGRLRVRRVTVAFDCGTSVAPDNIRAQIEGSVIMGLGSALSEQVTVSGGRTVPQNFDAYPLIKLEQAPEIDIHLLESPACAVGGAGEPVAPLPGPAVANAIFAATGRRIRSLPFLAQGLEVA